MPVSSSVANYAQAAAVVGGVVGQIVDANKRREFQEEFEKYSLDQQLLLATKIEAAKTQTEKLSILTQAIVSNQANANNSAWKKQMVPYVVAGGMAVVLMVLAIVMIKRR